MMSTLSGLLLGITAAAAVTVFYGENLTQSLREYVPQIGRPETAAISVAVSPEPEAGEIGNASPAPVITEDRELTLEPADVHLAKQWDEFSQNAQNLQPAGEFRWRECFQRAAAAHGVAESLLLAVASGESGFDPAARSDRDAIGLMQIRWPGTSKHLGVNLEADLYDPCTNVSAGAKYLAELTRRYQNDLHRAVAAYNYGPGRIDAGPLPQGAQWYSQYIYQHLQRVIGRPYQPSSSLLPTASRGSSGYKVLMTFNQPYRARDFMAFLEDQEPGLELAQRSESLGRYDVVVLYLDEADRQRAIDAVARTGLVALD